MDTYTIPRKVKHPFDGNYGGNGLDALHQDLYLNHMTEYKENQKPPPPPPIVAMRGSRQSGGRKAGGSQSHLGELYHDFTDAAVAQARRMRQEDSMSSLNGHGADHRSDHPNRITPMIDARKFELSLVMLAWELECQDRRNQFRRNMEQQQFERRNDDCLDDQIRQFRREYQIRRRDDKTTRATVPNQDRVFTEMNSSHYYVYENRQKVRAPSRRPRAPPLQSSLQRQQGQERRSQNCSEFERVTHCSGDNNKKKRMYDYCYVSASSSSFSSPLSPNEEGPLDFGGHRRRSGQRRHRQGYFDQRHSRHRQNFHRDSQYYHRRHYH